MAATSLASMWDDFLAWLDSLFAHASAGGGAGATSGGNPPTAGPVQATHYAGSSSASPASTGTTTANATLSPTGGIAAYLAGPQTAPYGGAPGMFGQKTDFLAVAADPSAAGVAALASAYTAGNVAAAAQGVTSAAAEQSVANVPGGYNVTINGQVKFVPASAVSGQPTVGKIVGAATGGAYG